MDFRALRAQIGDLPQGASLPATAPHRRQVARPSGRPVSWRELDTRGHPFKALHRIPDTPAAPASLAALEKGDYAICARSVAPAGSDVGPWGKIGLDRARA
eukprot:4327436-Pyramimonas_sp.AAC.1